MEFVDQTKRLFQEIENGDMVILPNKMPSSSNNEIYGLNGLFAPLISSGNSYSGNPKNVHGASTKNDITCSSTNPPQLSPFISDYGRKNSSNLQNQLQMAGTEGPFKFSCQSKTWLQEPLVQSTTSLNCSAALVPCISTWSSGQSALTSFEQQRPSETRLLGSQNISPAEQSSFISCRNAVQNFQDSTIPLAHSTEGLFGMEKISTSPSTFLELFQADDFTTAFSKSCPMDNWFPWIVPSPEQSNSTLATPLSGNLSQAMEVSSVSSGLNGAEVLPTKKILNDFSVENDLFDCLGVDFECG